MLTSDKLQLTIVLTWPRSLLSNTIFLVIENTPRCYRVWWSRSAIRRYPDVNIARQGLYIQWKRQGIICRQPEIMETIHYVEFWKYIPTNNRPQWCILNGGSVRIFVDNHYWYLYLQTMVQYWYSILSMHCVHLFSESHGYQAQLLHSWKYHTQYPMDMNIKYGHIDTEGLDTQHVVYSCTTFLSILQVAAC